MIKKIFIAGCSGYVGSKIIQHLCELGFEVSGVDIRYPDYKNSNLSIDVLPILTDYNGTQEWMGALAAAHNKADLTIHLLGLVGYPICEKNPELARILNTRLTEYITGHKPTIYFSAQSVYGDQGDKKLVSEVHTPNPIGVYAQTKYEGEQIARKNGAVIIRPATMYGLSPTMRWDNLVHDFMKMGIVENKITVFEPSAIRNVLSIEKLLECLMWLIPISDVRHNQIINLTSHSFKKMELADAITDRLHWIGLRPSLIGVDGHRDLEKRYYEISSTTPYVFNSDNQLHKLKTELTPLAVRAWNEFGERL